MRTTVWALALATLVGVVWRPAVGRTASGPDGTAGAPAVVAAQPIDPRAVLPPPPTTTVTGPAPAHPAASHAAAPLAGPAVLSDGTDQPDPFILRAGSAWFLYATGADGRNLQVSESRDLRAWTPAAELLPHLPGWAATGFTWAPAVLAVGSAYVLYYTVRDAAVGRQCISVAVASGPQGPFVDASDGPLVCQTSDAGSIDPDPFVASDGAPYLAWKSDDNGRGMPTQIGSQRLAPDGLRLVGPRRRLLSATAPWEAGVIEGPDMVVAGDRYFLFYGANRWDTTRAGIGYAVCAGPLGPCENRATTSPWIATSGAVVGPSGPDVFVDGAGVLRLAFHGWVATRGGPAVRGLWIAPLTLPAG